MCFSCEVVAISATSWSDDSEQLDFGDSLAHAGTRVSDGGAEAFDDRL
jgi:hypothetical protein